MQGYQKAGRAAMNEVDRARAAVLKKTFDRIVKARERKVIERLVHEHINGKLTPDKAFVAIMVIAELRSAGSDIGQEDLQ